MRPHDAIIVLANLMDASGNLNEETRARLSVACGIWASQRTSVLVTCGWAYRNDSDIRIADAMKSHAITHLGVPSDAILTEVTSRDTVGDAVFTKRNFANTRGWRDILVVTSAYHAERSQHIFSFIYGYPIAVAPAPSAMTAELTASESRSMEAFLKTFDGIEPGDDNAIYKRLAQRHPFYNGEVYPAITV